MSTVNVEQLVKAYIKMRDARQQLLREFDEADAKIKQQQDAVQQALLELCKETGTDGLKTSAGTVTRTVKTRYWTSDWNSMKNFIKENDAFELLEQRVHQTNMKSFLEENPNLMPPGMNIDSRYAITVRRK
jgi:ATP-dependent Lon protease